MNDTFENDPLFAPENAVGRSRVVFGKVGDFIKGTLVDIREIEDSGPYGKGGKVKIYEILTETGSFHELDDKRNPKDPAIKIGAGEYYSVFGKPSIDDAMRRIKLGQIVGIRFTEEKPSKTKGYNPSKVIKVFPGPMNEQWQGENSSDAAAY